MTQVYFMSLMPSQTLSSISSSILNDIKTTTIKVIARLIQEIVT